MTSYLHSFTRGLRNDGCTAFDGEYRLSEYVDEIAERHCHDFYELYIHLQGGQYYSVEDKLIALEPNQLIIIPPFCMHGPLYEHSMVNYERMFLNVMPKSLAAAGSEILDFPEMIQHVVAEGNFFYKISPQDAKVCREAIQVIRGIGPHTSPLERYNGYINMQRYMQVVAQTIASAGSATSKEVTYPFVQQIMLYLDSHFTEQLTLHSIADHFHVSVSYLCREFARYNLHSIYDYVLYRRVMFACEQIKKGGNLTTIAYQCGFNNYNTFMRTFKKHIGMPPREYFKQEQGK